MPADQSLVEEWKVIPFAPRYQASNHGRIKSVYGWVMKLTLGNSGYLVCDLNYKKWRVNRVICWTFHGEPPTNEHHAAHKDSNRQNNFSDNLYWATPLENGADLRLTNRKKGESNVLTESDVRKIKELVGKGYKVATVHQLWFPHVHYSTLSQIIHKRTWTHVDG